MAHKSLLGLDIGHKRIGVAIARGGVRLAVPLTTIEVDGTEIDQLKDIIAQEDVSACVVGLPRNQSGVETSQSQYSRSVAGQIVSDKLEIVFQDESLTSVRAHDELGHRSHDKARVDALAATYILQDYLEKL